MTNEKETVLSLKQFPENCRSKTPRCRKLSHSSQIQNDALIHRVGLKVKGSIIWVFYVTQSILISLYNASPFMLDIDNLWSLPRT